MKKLISFSLWGNNKKYTIGAIKNSELAQTFYPDWKCRFYCANDVPSDIIYELENFSTNEVIKLNEVGNWKFTTKRFLPMSENGIERIIFRDTDSRFSKREVEAVKEWEKNNTILHVMKDHPYHGGFPILAGMFGILGDYIPNISAMLDIYEREINEQYHYDQIFLAKYIWTLFKNNVTIHDEFFSNKPFPTIRDDLSYVGEPYDYNDLPFDISHRIILKNSIK